MQEKEEACVLIRSWDVMFTNGVVSGTYGINRIRFYVMSFILVRTRIKTSQL